MNKFAVLNFRSNVGVTVAVLGKKKNSVMVPALFLWTDFDIISYKYDNIRNKCVFQHCRSKVNVTGAILGKICHGSSAVCELIFIKLLILTISRTSWHFSHVDATSRSQLHIAGAFITFSDCLVFKWTFLS